MSKMKWKQMLAGVFVACAFGGIAIGIAWATPGAGVGQTPIAGPVALDEIHIVSQSRTHGVSITTRGAWESRVVENQFMPGGNTGWHSHPGPAFVHITAGTMTLYQADGTSAVYPTGTGFVQAPGDVHLARNEGTVELKAVTFYLLPAGEAVRTDEPDPTGG